MQDLTTKDGFDAFLEAVEGHTPGPLRWFGNTHSKTIYLGTENRGRLVVMDFVRWGTQGSTVRFRSAECLMDKAQDIAKPDHNGNFEPDHPDATLQKYAPALLADNIRLRGVLERIRTILMRPNFSSIEMVNSIFEEVMEELQVETEAK